MATHRGARRDGLRRVADDADGTRRRRLLSARLREPSRSRRRHADVVDLTPPGAEPHDLELTRARRGATYATRSSSSTLGGGFLPARRGRRRRAETDGRSTCSRAGRPARRRRGRERPARLARPDPLRADRPCDRRRARPSDGGRRIRRAARAARRGVRARARALRASRDRDEPRGVRPTSPTATSSSRSRSSACRPRPSPTRGDIAGLVDEVRGAGATTVFFEPLVSSDSPRPSRARRASRRPSLDPLEGLTTGAGGRAAPTTSASCAQNLAALRAALGCT